LWSSDRRVTDGDHVVDSGHLIRKFRTEDD